MQRVAYVNKKEFAPIPPQAGSLMKSLLFYLVKFDLYWHFNNYIYNCKSLYYEINNFILIFFQYNLH